jgi:hypothetical protein
MAAGVRSEVRGTVLHVAPDLQSLLSGGASGVVELHYERATRSTP